MGRGILISGYTRRCRGHVWLELVTPLPNRSIASRRAGAWDNPGRCRVRRSSDGGGDGRGLQATPAFVRAGTRRTRLVGARGAHQRRGQSAFCLAQDDVGERPGASVLRQMAIAVSYADDDRAGVAGQLESDPLAGRRSRECPGRSHEDGLDEALARFETEREAHFEQGHRGRTRLCSGMAGLACWPVLARVDGGHR